MTRWAVLPLIVTALACSQAGNEDPVLATYDGGEITSSEFSARTDSRGRNDDPEAALKALALTEVLATAAMAEDLERSPGLRLHLERLADRPWVRALENRIREQSAATEEAIDEYLEAHRHQLDKPRKVRLANIFRRAEPGDSAARRQVRRRMEEIHARLLAGEDFASLARSESEAVNKLRGGKMGAVPPGQLKSHVEEVAFALEEGEISPVLEVPEGFVILQSDGTVEAYTMSEQEARERIREALGRWAFKDAWDELRRDLLAQTEFTFHTEAFESADDETVVATLANGTITHEELLGLAKTAARRPVVKLAPARARTLLESHLSASLAAARARELELRPDPKAAQGAAKGRLAVLADAELERRARQAMPEITEVEARAFFDTNPKLFYQPQRYFLNVIQLRLDDDPNTLRAQTELGRTTIDDIRSGETTFAEAARRVSQHPTATTGGELGWRTRRWMANLGPNVLDVFDRLEVGTVSDLIRQDHLWILEVSEVEAARQLTFEESLADARLGAEAQAVREATSKARAEALLALEASFEIVRRPVADPAGGAEERTEVDATLGAGDADPLER